MTCSPLSTLPYSDNLQRNLITYLTTLNDLASRTRQPARLFETEVALFFGYVGTHFGSNAPKAWLWCKHVAEDLLMNGRLPTPVTSSHKTPSFDGEYLEVLEQTRKYLSRLVDDMARDLMGCPPDDLRFYIEGLVSICPPEAVKPLLLKVQHTTENYLWLGGDVSYQPTPPSQRNEAVQEPPAQGQELQKHITDGHALANYISWRLLKFRKILWFHLVPHDIYGEMADACMAFFTNQKSSEKETESVP